MATCVTIVGLISAAFLIELVHRIIGRIYNFQPLLTRAEVRMLFHWKSWVKVQIWPYVSSLQVYKTGVTHYFSMREAREDFSYTPEPRDLEGVVEWFRLRGHGKTPQQSGGQWRTLWKMAVRTTLAVCIFMLVMYCLPLVT